MMPVPLVSVRNCGRNPIEPRAGIRNSMRTRPLPWFTIFVIVPRRIDLGDDDALKLLGDVDDELLDRLHHLAVDLFRHDVRPGHLQLESFAPHHLDEDRELQLASPEHLHLLGESVGSTRIEHVAEQLTVEPILDLA